ncbi:hypothetical protein BT63DRAFT_442328 [Microthyrium microscopicum]|uniref:PHD-type domain-containing protein n=1 Tax=Microthyrium microscopicum TaxID=703497 RepID=A0A6A6U4E4_9PEZI|nr:hypothetical protein BT63DRAFT_442328 [Microthyrium microscopicum]
MAYRNTRSRGKAPTKPTKTAYQLESERLTKRCEALEPFEYDLTSTGEDIEHDGSKKDFKIDELETFLSHEKNPQLLILADEKGHYRVNKDNIEMLIPKYFQMTRRLYRSPATRTSCTRILSLIGESLHVVKGFIFYSYTAKLEVPKAFAFYINAAVNPRLPGAPAMPDLTFALDMYEFALRYGIGKMERETCSWFVGLVKEHRFHVSFLGQFLRIGEDFELPVVVKRGMKPLYDAILEELLRQFEQQVAMCNKVPTKAFRDVFGDVPGSFDRQVALVLEKAGYAFVIAKRCVQPMCLVGADGKDDVCGQCGGDLGLIGYKDERAMAEFHWAVPAVLVPGQELYCVCDEEADEQQMIRCSVARCKTIWFHPGCMGLWAKPEKGWICPDCEEMR